MRRSRFGFHPDSVLHSRRFSNDSEPENDTPDTTTTVRDLRQQEPPTSQEPATASQPATGLDRFNGALIQRVVPSSPAIVQDTSQYSSRRHQDHGHGQDTSRMLQGPHWLPESEQSSLKVSPSQVINIHVYDNPAGGGRAEGQGRRPSESLERQPSKSQADSRWPSISFKWICCWMFLSLMLGALLLSMLAITSRSWADPRLEPEPAVDRNQVQPGALKPLVATRDELHGIIERADDAIQMLTETRQRSAHEPPNASSPDTQTRDAWQQPLRVLAQYDAQIPEALALLQAVKELARSMSVDLSPVGSNLSVHRKSLRQQAADMEHISSTASSSMTYNILFTLASSLHMQSVLFPKHPCSWLPTWKRESQKQWAFVQELEALVEGLRGRQVEVNAKADRLCESIDRRAEYVQLQGVEHCPAGGGSGELANRLGTAKADISSLVWFCRYGHEKQKGRRGYDVTGGINRLDSWVVRPFRDELVKFDRDVAAVKQRERDKGRRCAERET